MIKRAMFAISHHQYLFKSLFLYTNNKAILINTTSTGICVRACGMFGGAEWVYNINLLDNTLTRLTA